MVAAAEMFRPVGETVCPRQQLRALNPGEQLLRIRQLESLDRDVVVGEMLPNAFLAYMQDGSLWRVLPNEINSKLPRLEKIHNNLPQGFYVPREIITPPIEEIRGLVVLPVSTWGKWDLMIIDCGDARGNVDNLSDKEKLERMPPAMHDIPERILEVILPLQSRILRGHMQHGNVVHAGGNNSMGALESEGLMSVLHPHYHYWTDGDVNSATVFEDALQGRKQRWDNKVSYLRGLKVTAAMNETVFPYYLEGAHAWADDMGLAMYLPNFTPEMMGSIEYIKKFLEPLSLLMHTEKQKNHRLAFASELDPVIDQVLDARLHRGKIDLARYKAHFNKRNLLSLGDMDDEEWQIAFKLQGMFPQLRAGNGWAIETIMRRDEADALVLISDGNVNLALGPIEGKGRKLTRPDGYLEGTEMEERRNDYFEIIRNAIGVDYPLAA